MIINALGKFRGESIKNSMVGHVIRKKELLNVSLSVHHIVKIVLVPDRVRAPATGPPWP